MEATAFFIVRNHSDSLQIALASLHGFIDRILVVDTGSTDSSIELALTFHAKVIHFDWKNDFAAACNAALDAIRTPWALLMNPDETLHQPSATKLHKALQAQDQFAYCLRVQQQLLANQTAYGTSNRQWRLFRNHPSLRYQGRLHPFLNPAPDVVAPRLGFNTTDLDVTIFRHAYRNQVTYDKVRWTVRLIEAELNDRPKQVDLIIELAQNLSLLGDTRYHDNYREAAALLKPTLEKNGPPTIGSGPLFEYLLTVDPPAGQPPLPITRPEALKFASQWMLRNPPVVWAMATERFRARDYATAAALLIQLLTLGREGNYNAELSFDPDIIGRAAMMNLGKCYTLLGKADDAKKSFEALANDPTYGVEARQLLERFKEAS